MALDVVAVEAFTAGRLNRDDDETQRQLDAAMAAARRHCGWHVTPAYTEQTLTIDGPGTVDLVLPTLQLAELTDLSEDGVALDVADLSWSARGIVRKRNRTPWTAEYGAITVVISHGIAAAPDFDAVILSAIERGGFSADVGPKVVGPFQYFESSVGSEAVFTPAELAILDRYALEPAP